MDWIQVAVALTIALFGGVGTQVAAHFLRNKPKEKIDVADALTDASLQLLTPLTKRVEALEAEVVILKGQLRRRDKTIILLLEIIQGLTETLHVNNILIPPTVDLEKFVAELEAVGYEIPPWLRREVRKRKDNGH